MTQHDKILRYLEINKTITPMQAFMELGITKLATRISEMRRAGIEIAGEMQYREDSRYMKYWRV